MFRISPGGTKTVLYLFKGDTTDGGLPYSGLIADSAGNLYGTTAIGGGGQGCFVEGSVGCGTVFKVTPGGTETVLYSFCSLSLPSCNDGWFPVASLIADKSGNLYGTTQQGGAFGAGTVFKLAPNGTETVLYSFNFGGDGANPRGGLLVDSGGNLYGMITADGILGGVVYRLSPPIPPSTEWINTVLHSFQGGTDGTGPAAAGSLIADNSGNLYGLTTYGGGATACFYGCGTVFKLTGTGFVTGTPFSAFSSKLAIGKRSGYFELLSNVTLGSGAPYLDLPTQAVTVQVGPYSVTIPAGSFVKGSAYGEADFDGTINGVNIHARVWLTGTKQYLVLIKANGANMSGAANPVPVTLTLGPNTGTANVTGAIFP